MGDVTPVVGEDEFLLVDMHEVGNGVPPAFWHFGWLRGQLHSIAFDASAAELQQRLVDMPGEFRGQRPAVTIFERLSVANITDEDFRSVAGLGVVGGHSCTVEVRRPECCSARASSSP